MMEYYPELSYHLDPIISKNGISIINKFNSNSPMILNEFKLYKSSVISLSPIHIQKYMFFLMHRISHIPISDIVQFNIKCFKYGFFYSIIYQHCEHFSKDNLQSILLTLYNYYDNSYLLQKIGSIYIFLKIILEKLKHLQNPFDFDKDEIMFDYLEYFRKMLYSNSASLPSLVDHIKHIENNLDIIQEWLECMISLLIIFCTENKQLSIFFKQQMDDKIYTEPVHLCVDLLKAHVIYKSRKLDKPIPIQTIGKILVYNEQTTQYFEFPTDLPFYSNSIITLKKIIESNTLQLLHSFFESLRIDRKNCIYFREQTETYPFGKMIISNRLPSKVSNKLSDELSELSDELLEELLYNKYIQPKKDSEGKYLKPYMHYYDRMMIE